ncbi:cache domain-containing protein [Fervidobacterium thailandense]|nr:cache domain-containing protein [Fervidobacterium thailandense]
MKIRTWLNVTIPSLIAFAIAVASLVGFFSLNAVIKYWEKTYASSEAKFIERQIYHEQEKAMMIIDTLLNDENVVRAFAQKDRDLLISHVMRYHTFYSLHYDLFQIHFHTPEAVSFLRTSDLSKFGDDLKSYRKDVLHVIATKQPTFSTGVGRMGAMIRYIAPVFYEGEYVGSVEANINFATSFAKKLHGDAIVRVFYNEKGERVDIVSRSRDDVEDFTAIYKLDELLQGHTLTLVRGKYAYIAIPIKDFEGKTYAGVFLRTSVEQIQRFRVLMILLQFLVTIIFMAVILIFSHRIGMKLQKRIQEVEKLLNSI